MNRRDFLKALGFTLAGLPLAGKPILEPNEVGEVDLDGTDAELPESTEETMNQNFADGPYCYDKSARACWLDLDDIDDSIYFDIIDS